MVLHSYLLFYYNILYTYFRLSFPFAITPHTLHPMTYYHTSNNVYTCACINIFVRACTSRGPTGNHRRPCHRVIRMKYTCTFRLNQMTDLWNIIFSSFNLQRSNQTVQSFCLITNGSFYTCYSSYKIFFPWSLNIIKEQLQVPIHIIAPILLL